MLTPGVTNDGAHVYKVYLAAVLDLYVGLHLNNGADFTDGQTRWRSGKSAWPVAGRLANAECMGGMRCTFEATKEFGEFTLLDLSIPVRSTSTLPRK